MYEPNAWRSPAAAATRSVEGKDTRTQASDIHVIVTILNNVLFSS
jgi:hypothetical protein